MKIVTVIGARPQFIKCAVVSAALAKTPDCQEVIVHTGQHYDPMMSDVFFSELGIQPPQHHLEIGSGPHGQQTGRMLEALEKVFTSEKPDWVLVYGDTNSTLAGALAASKMHIKVAHVEAGLRSFNRRMPEELNRILTDNVSELLFAPTETAVKNLANEGVPAAKVKRVGDVMYDATLFYSRRAETQSSILQTLELTATPYILATIHRAENTDVPERLTALLDGFSEIAKDLPIVLPLHPRTKKFADERGLLEKLGKGVKVIEPIGYLDMTRLESKATLIATDSGGVQKEAYFHGVPCVTLRDETEWTELVKAGWNRLAPPLSSAAVVSGIRGALGTKGTATQLYGDGHSADQIVNWLKGE